MPKRSIVDKWNAFRHSINWMLDAFLGPQAAHTYFSVTLLEVMGGLGGGGGGGVLTLWRLLHILLHFDPPFSGLWKMCIVSTPIFWQRWRKFISTPSFFYPCSVSMAWCGIVVAPLPTHWSCCSLALGHRYLLVVHPFNIMHMGTRLCKIWWYFRRHVGRPMPAAAAFMGFLHHNNISNCPLISYLPIMVTSPLL